MKDLVFVGVVAILVLALMIFQLRSLKRFHPNAEWLIGLLKQLRRTNYGPGLKPLPDKH